jgi:hypothetical protein
MIADSEENESNSESARPDARIFRDNKTGCGWIENLKGKLICLK